MSGRLVQKLNVCTVISSSRFLSLQVDNPQGVIRNRHGEIYSDTLHTLNAYTHGPRKKWSTHIYVQRTELLICCQEVDVDHHEKLST